MFRPASMRAVVCFDLLNEYFGLVLLGSTKCASGQEVLIRLASSKSGVIYKKRFSGCALIYDITALVLPLPMIASHTFTMYFPPVKLYFETKMVSFLKITPVTR